MFNIKLFYIFSTLKLTCIEFIKKEKRRNETLGKDQFC